MIMFVMNPAIAPSTIRDDPHDYLLATDRRRSRMTTALGRLDPSRRWYPALSPKAPLSS